MKYVTQWCLSMSVSQWCHIFHQPYRGVEYRAETCDVSYTYTWHDRNKWCQLHCLLRNWHHLTCHINDMTETSDVSYKWHFKWCQLQMTCQVMSVTNDMSSDVSYKWHVKWCQLHMTCQVMSVTHDMSSDVSYTYKWHHLTESRALLTYWHDTLTEYRALLTRWNSCFSCIYSCIYSCIGRMNLLCRADELHVNDFIW